MHKTPSHWLRLEQFCGSAFSSSGYRRRSQLFLVSALESTDRGVVLGRYLRERVPLDIVEPKQGTIYRNPQLLTPERERRKKTNVFASGHSLPLRILILNRAL
jgi:hypothetical protein